MSSPAFTVARLVLGHAAIDKQFYPVDKCGTLASQKDNSTGNLPGLSNSACRYTAGLSLDESLQILRCGACCGTKSRCVGGAGADDIYADSAFPEVHHPDTRKTISTQPWQRYRRSSQVCLSRKRW